MLILDEFGVLVAGIFGLLVGSFLNVVISRLPRILERQWWSGAIEMVVDVDSYTRVTGKILPAEFTNYAQNIAGTINLLPAFSLSKPRSKCTACGHKIAWYENIPVLSFILLKAKCSACKKKISLRYPLIELFTGGIFAFCAWRWNITAVGAAWAVFSSILIAQFFIDFDTQYLPDDLNYPLLWLGLAAAASGWTISLSDAVWGAALGYLSLWTVYHIYRFFTKKEGMGYGDFKLLAALGAWFGANYLLCIILMSSVVGAVLGGCLLIAGRLANKDIPIAFGPFLVGAGLILMLIGPENFRTFLPFAFPAIGL